MNIMKAMVVAQKLYTNKTVQELLNDERLNAIVQEYAKKDPELLGIIQELLEILPAGKQSGSP